MAEEEIVYHYCSVESFFNIIKSKKFWLSDARYMNDTHEIKWMDKMVDEILDEPFQKKNVEANSSRLAFDKVLYKNINELKEAIQISCIDGHCSDYSLFLKELGVLVKNPAFSEEQEYRLIHAPENNRLINKKVTISEKNYRVSNGQIIPYFELDFKDYIQIDSITLGSKCKLEEDDLKEFLKSKNFESVKIEYSKSTYR